MWTTQAGVAHRVHSSQQQTQKIATASIRSKEQPALPRCSELSSKHPQIPPRRLFFWVCDVLDKWTFVHLARLVLLKKRPAQFIHPELSGLVDS